MRPQIAIPVWSDRRAVAAVEFALILPLMLILFLGSVDAAGYIKAYRHTHQAADAYARILSQWTATAANANAASPSTFTAGDFNTLVDAMPFLIPEVLSQGARVHQDWTAFVFTLTYIEMVNLSTTNPQAAVGPGNLAQPQLWWSITTGNKTDLRCGLPMGSPAPCLQITPSLPPALLQVEGGLAVSDVKFTYIPLVLPSVFKHTITASAYFSTRYGQTILGPGNRQTNGFWRWPCLILATC